MNKLAMSHTIEFILLLEGESFFEYFLVTSSAGEPLPGWIDNYYGPTGGCAATALGIMKNIYLNPEVDANLVPVDYTINALLTSAWDVSVQTNRYSSSHK